MENSRVKGILSVHFGHMHSYICNKMRVCGLITGVQRRFYHGAERRSAPLRFFRSEYRADDATPYDRPTIEATLSDPQ